MAQMTVLGASGYIGSRLAAALRRQGHAVATPARGDDLTRAHLGTVFYCVGLTADFRTRPFDTVEAHVCLLRRVLRNGRFDRLVYLSSARLYLGLGGEADEGRDLTVNPARPDDLYNLSKALGESLALNSGRPACVVRPSNVYGGDLTSENFLPSVIRSALRDGAVTLRTAPQSAKDYVHIDDLTDALVRVGLGGRQSVYNLAGGRNVTNAELLGELRRLTGCAVRTADGAPTVAFPPISVARARREFGYAPRGLLDEMPRLVGEFATNRRAWS